MLAQLNKWPAFSLPSLPSALIYSTLSEPPPTFLLHCLWDINKSKRSLLAWIAFSLCTSILFLHFQPQWTRVDRVKVNYSRATTRLLCPWVWALFFSLLQLTPWYKWASWSFKVSRDLPRPPLQVQLLRGTKDLSSASGPQLCRPLSHHQAITKTTPLGSTKQDIYKGVEGARWGFGFGIQDIMCHQASLSLMGAERVRGTAMGLDPRNGETKKE